MKLLVVLVSLIVASNAFAAVLLQLDKEIVQKMKQKMEEVGAQCAEEENPNSDDIARLLSHQMPVTHEGKCVIYCVYKYFKTINEDGTIDIENGVAVLEPIKENDPEIYEKFVNIFKKCATSITLDGDPCNTGANLIQCSVDEGKSEGISVEMYD